MPGYAIPDVDGVPNIAFAPGFASDIVLAVADAVSLFSQLSAPQWGIFLGGAPVVIADSVIAFEFRQDWLIADYPEERGGFASYNKVQTPYDIRIRLTAGGNAVRREALLASAQAIAGDTNLYDAVMPEQTFPNCNVAHVDFHRTAQNGLGLLILDMYLQQIQQAAQQTFQNTAQPSGASPVNGGTVQPTTPSAANIAGLNVADVAAAGGVP